MLLHSLNIEMIRALRNSFQCYFRRKSERKKNRIACNTRVADIVCTAMWRKRKPNCLRYEIVNLTKTMRTNRCQFLIDAFCCVFSFSATHAYRMKSCSIWCGTHRIEITFNFSIARVPIRSIFIEFRTKSITYRYI